MRIAFDEAVNAGVVSVTVTRKYVLHEFFEASIALYGFSSCKSGTESDQVSFVAIARGQIMNSYTSSSSQRCSCFSDGFSDVQHSGMTGFINIYRGA